MSEVSDIPSVPWRGIGEARKAAAAKVSDGPQPARVRVAPLGLCPAHEAPAQIADKVEEARVVRRGRGRCIYVISQL